MTGQRLTARAVADRKSGAVTARFAGAVLSAGQSFTVTWYPDGRTIFEAPEPVPEAEPEAEPGDFWSAVTK